MISGEQSIQDTGLLIHGRHLQAIGWAQMMWGRPAEQALGSAPTAVLSILDEDPTRFKVITMGTGASQRSDGTIEAEATRDLLLNRFDDLDEFEQIRGHRLWPRHKELIRGLVGAAILDTRSRNTKQEIAAAAQLFGHYAVSRVIQVTGASHAPRCQSGQSEARQTGVIPASQRWRLVADDIPYPGTQTSDTVVIEQPHRADDPDYDLLPGQRPADIFKGYFSITPGDRRRAFLSVVAQAVADAKQP